MSTYSDEDMRAMLRSWRPVDSNLPTRSGASEAGSSCAPVTGYAPLRWSAERPAAAGWWWWERPDHEKEPVLVGDDGDVMMRSGILRLDNVMEYLGGRWAGPLPEPESAPDAETGHIAEVSHGDSEKRS